MNIKSMALSVVLVATVAGKSLQAQQYNPDVINYINTYKGLAMTEMQRSGIPASIILAQGIHESEAGTSELVKKSNNHFGIKCRDDWKGPAVYHDDDSRGECFRSYATAGDSYRDHSDFLRGSTRYADLFKNDPDDYAAWAYGLKKAGYATNIHYPQILIKYIKDYNLQQYTLIAMGRLRPEEEIVLQAPGTDNGVAEATGAAGNATPGGGTMGNGADLPGTGNTAPGMTGPADHGTPGTMGDPVGADTLNRNYWSRYYPEGEFMINNTRVVFAKAGTSLLAVANQYELSLGRLLEFNDLKEEDVLARAQLLYLQRKRRTGAGPAHIVRQGESLYDICQLEAVRYEDLLKMNKLENGAQPAAGTMIWLKPNEPTGVKPKETTN